MFLINSKSLINDFLLLPATVINESDMVFAVVIFFVNTLLLSVTKILQSLFAVLAFKTTVWNSVVTAFKFLILIALMIFIRGGIPRYRYDFLTKIGWIKFLSLVLSVFLSSILLVYLC